MSKGDSRVMNDTNRRPLQLTKLSTTDSYARMKEGLLGTEPESRGVCAHVCSIEQILLYL